MGKSSKTKVGSHYRLALHMGLSLGEIDAYLEFRAADKTAWSGSLTSSGKITVNQPQLFGGEKDQGGLEGTMHVMFGEPTQVPSAYLQGLGRDQTAAWRGFLTWVWEGGRWGAMSPFAQKPSHKIRRILKGWSGNFGDDPCWYPEAAEVPMGIGEILSLGPTSQGWKYRIGIGSDDYISPSYDDSQWAVGASPFASSTGHPYAASGGYPDKVGTYWPLDSYIWIRRKFHLSDVVDFSLEVFVDNYATVWVNGVLVLPRVGNTSNPSSAAFRHTINVPAGVLRQGQNVIVLRGDQGDGTDPRGGSGPSPSDWTYAAFKILSSPTFGAMNAAHALAYVRTDPEKGGEAWDSLDTENLTAAADTLYNEGFGLCWEYDPERHTPDAWSEEVGRIIGGSFERSLVDGKWRLHLVRDDYDVHALPIMSDSTGVILSFREIPSTLYGAVNVMGLRYFDVEAKEQRTVWARSPGLVRQFGETKELVEMPWISTGALAARVVERMLREKITPTRSFEITTDPVSFREIDRSQTVRFQSLLRGIADMVCIVGERESGTLKSGAMRWALTQHVYGMADTAYVEVEHGVDTRPTQTPEPIALGRVFEAPYIDVVASLPRAELDALPDDVGYLLAVAADPGRHLDYTLSVEPTGGAHAPVATGDWCPTATLPAGADYLSEGPFALSGASGLQAVRVGEPVLLDDEICVVTALDLEAEPQLITLGRACADTVPALHAPGSRLWFFDGATAVDTTEYTEAETIEARLLSNTGSQQLALADALALPITFAGRSARPYPPAGVQLNGQAYPTTVVGDVTVTAYHRDRVAQADQLYDTTEPDIGPEPGTTYVVRNVDTVTDTETYHADGITTFPHVVPAGDLAVANRLEVYAERDGLESWQRVRVLFTAAAVLLAEDGSPITAENGDPIIMR